MANNEQQPDTTPAPVEATSRKEILGRERAGLQAALLLDGIVPQEGGLLDRGKLRSVKTEIASGNHPKLELITKSSYQDRGVFWKQDEFKTLTFKDQMTKWGDETSQYLQSFTAEDKKEEAAILNRIGMGIEKGASGIYDEFFAQNKGEIGYFAAKVAGALSEAEIATHIKLIQSLGRFYGENSAEIARHLTEAVKNVSGENFDEFVDTAVGQFSPAMEGVGVLKAVQERAIAWDKTTANHHATTPQEPQTQEALRQPVQPEQAKTPEQPLVVQAEWATETKTVRDRINQDAYVRDTENGTFGVFDGMGSYKRSKEVAEAAAKQIEAGLVDPLPHDLKNAVEHVKQVVKNVAEGLSRDQDDKFQAMVADIKANATGTLPDEEFDSRYAGPKRTRSWAQWTKQKLDPSKPDGISDELKEFINDQIYGATTGSVVKIWRGEQEERKAIIANVGDSRVYHFSAADGEFRIVTVDDDALNDLLGEEEARKKQDAQGGGVQKLEFFKGKTIKLKRSDPLHLAAWISSQTIQERYPWGPDDQVEVPLALIDDVVMTKSIPGVDLTPKMQTIDIKPGDKIAVVSDGVYKAARTLEMEKALTDPANQDARKAAQALVQLAARYGPDDDATAVVISL